jgi:hypothetical protein
MNEFTSRELRWFIGGQSFCLLIKYLNRLRSSSRELRRFIPAQMEVHTCLCSLDKLPQIDLRRNMNKCPKEPWEDRL